MRCESEMTRHYPDHYYSLEPARKYYPKEIWKRKWELLLLLVLFAAEIATSENLNNAVAFSICGFFCIFSCVCRVGSIEMFVYSMVLLPISSLILVSIYPSNAATWVVVALSALSLVGSIVLWRRLRKQRSQK